MRYDPLRKNVVRPFRALVTFVCGLVKGFVHSLLTMGSRQICEILPNGFRLKSCLKKSYSKGGLRKTVSIASHPTPLLESHPLRCFKRTTSEQIPLRASRHRRAISEVVPAIRSSEEIQEVLKTYNTTEGRDRLISKLEGMKSKATDTIKNLSHRNYAEQSLSRRELITCQQEMVQLTRQVNAAQIDKSTSRNGVRRSVSVMDRPTSGLSQRRSESVEGMIGGRPIALPANLMVTSLKEGAEKVSKKISSESRSESLRMKLKQHEQMADSLRSRYAALSSSKGREGQ